MKRDHGPFVFYRIWHPKRPDPTGSGSGSGSVTLSCESYYRIQHNWRSWDKLRKVVNVLNRKENLEHWITTFKFSNENKIVIPSHRELTHFIHENYFFNTFFVNCTICKFCNFFSVISLPEPALTWWFNGSQIGKYLRRNYLPTMINK